MLNDKNMEVLKQVLANNTQAEAETDQTIEASPKTIPQVGETVSLGKWPYSADGTAEQLQWIVLRLNEKKGEALLITKECIDCQPCDKGNHVISTARTPMVWMEKEQPPYAYKWTKSYLRTWLQQEFYKKCFSDSEKDRIIDRNGPDGKDHIKSYVNLLSAAEALELFTTDDKRQASPTPYCGANKEHIAWWLTDSGDFYDEAAVVFEDGSIYEKPAGGTKWSDVQSEDETKRKPRKILHGMDVTKKMGVRPVIRIRL